MECIDSYSIVDKVFKLAGLKLEKISLLPVSTYVVQRNLKERYGVGIQLTRSYAKSVYAASLQDRSPWFGLEVRHGKFGSMLLASQHMPNDVRGKECELLIEDTSSIISDFKRYGLDDTHLELVDLSECDSVWSQSWTVLDNGNGFYETLIENSLNNRC